MKSNGNSRKTGEYSSGAWDPWRRPKFTAYQCSMSEADRTSILARGRVND